MFWLYSLDPGGEIWYHKFDVIVGLGNGLLLNKHQAITSTNAVQYKSDQPINCIWNF